MPRQPKPPAPPDHLSDGPKGSKVLWTAILKDWPIDDSAHLAVLQAGLEARDRAERCRQRIDEEGEAVRDRFQQLKAHPLLAAERDARSQFVNCIKSLGLDPGEVQ